MQSSESANSDMSSSNPSSPTSTKMGVRPACRIAFACAMKVSAGVITFLIPVFAAMADKAMASAIVPLQTEMACFTASFSQNLFSNSSTNLPPAILPV